jgi:hypothetical protein
METVIRHPSIGREVTVRLTEAELAELEHRACQIGIDRSELIRRYVRAGLAVRAAAGTVVDATTGEHLVPATESHLRIWLRSYNSLSAPGIFAIDSDGRPVALPVAARSDRRVTLRNPPDGLDTTDPDSSNNLRLLEAVRQAALADRARWMSEPLSDRNLNIR